MYYNTNYYNTLARKLLPAIFHLTIFAIGSDTNIFSPAKTHGPNKNIYLYMHIYDCFLFMFELPNCYWILYTLLTAYWNRFIAFGLCCEEYRFDNVLAIRCVHREIPNTLETWVTLTCRKNLGKLKHKNHIHMEFHTANFEKVCHILVETRFLTICFNHFSIDGCFGLVLHLICSLFGK